MESNKTALVFDSAKYEVRTVTAQGRTLTCRAFEGIEYCARPVDTIQKMNLYVPEAYYQGETLSGYDLHTAPIFLPNSVGGYLAGPSEEPGEDRDGHANALFAALEHGYVVASIGVRGRNTENGLGKPPAFVVDMKAGIRYLRKNREQIPGNVERMITSGTSAGGALSALTGASGNHPDYEPYLREIGAAEESDAVFASNCYCPIHNLENADMAYEWQFCGCNTYHGMKIEKIPEGMKFTPVEGELTKEQIAQSEKLEAQFPAYLNSLGLRDEQGEPLTLEADGTGSFAGYIEQCLLRSAQKELDTHDSRDRLSYCVVPGSEVEKQPALTIEDGRAEAVDLPLYFQAITRMKQVPAFHMEANELGVETYGLINPISYIQDDRAETVKYWRIRHGSYDRDTSLAIPVILERTLRKQGMQVDFGLPWGIPHRGDYDLEELFAWIDGVCG